MGKRHPRQYTPCVLKMSVVDWRWNDLFPPLHFPCLSVFASWAVTSNRPLMTNIYVLLFLLHHSPLKWGLWVLIMFPCPANACIINAHWDQGLPGAFTGQVPLPLYMPQINPWERGLHFLLAFLEALLSKFYLQWLLDQLSSVIFKRDWLELPSFGPRQLCNLKFNVYNDNKDKLQDYNITRLGLTTSQVVRLVGLLLVFASQK